MTAAKPVLDVRELEVSVGATPVVRGVSFALAAGQRFGLVGESGSGKSLTALAIMGLTQAPVRATGGEVFLGDVDLLTLRRRQLDRIRGSRISMVYQDPGASLNPLMKVGSQLVEAIRLHTPVSRDAASRQAIELLGSVGVPHPSDRMRAYPHEFSGGMRQRVMIAMALACEPEVILCDEPTTALDVTTQARVISVIYKLCQDRGVAAVLITHDMGLAAGFCDDIAVMYAGQLMEVASTERLYAEPRHPYSRALMSATVDLEADVARALPAIAGQPPVPAEFGVGCPFAPRCPLAIEECVAGPVVPRRVGGSIVRCIRAEEPLPAEEASPIIGRVTADAHGGDHE